MSNKKIVAQTYFEISEVKHRKVTKPLNYSTNVFTYLQSVYTPAGMEPISLNTLEQLINDYSNAKGGKTANRCILKGLYKNGFNGDNCVQNVPYLFFDIDVKKDKENNHLLAESTNRIIFEALQEVAVLVWRSNSGYGIAGVLFVPQLASYLNDQKDLHLLAGKAVTDYLSEYLHTKTGIQKITFDEAQSKLRQIRFLAEQTEFRKLNKTPFEFSFKAEKKIKEIIKGIPAYRFESYRSAFGTIYEQFNQDNDILEIAKQCRFEVLTKKGTKKIRVKHPNTTSDTSGEIDTSLNIYFNYSESLSSKKAFTPSAMVCYFQFGGDWGAFRKYLVEQGYQEKTKPQNEVKRLSKELKEQLRNITDESEAGEVIFKYCYDLHTLSPEEKRKFIKETCINPKFEKHFKAYLNLSDYVLKFDEHFTIKNYVSDVLPDVLDYTDNHKKVILRAETGKGKTTAFVRDFHKYRPNARILILEPLTIIIKQNEKEYRGKGVFVDGSNVSYELERTFYEKLVFATYEQGAKILHYSQFDYVVIDEVHQLLTANSFKRSVIAELTPYLEKNKVIGLTGTPTAIFKEIGYKIINVDVQKPKQTNIEVRYLNKRPYDIALSHLRNVTGKTIIRLNDIKGIEILKKQLIATKLYDVKEILVLHSNEKIKASQDYRDLAHNRRFADNVKLVLTTSLIDEGLSINQSGFTDVVFIETSYNPRPEPIKQFFARFRNEEPTRKNYLYLRLKKNQTAGRFVPEWSYNGIFKGLNTEAEETAESEVLSTYNGLFSNDPFFYEDKMINKYFLAFSVTDTLFKTLNIVQFRYFLEENFNLQLTVNEKYEIESGLTSIESYTRKEVKKQIAGLWLKYLNDVLQVLALHSLDTSIRSKITVQQTAIDPALQKFVIEQIKDFEKLYKNSVKIKALGVAEPNVILLKNSIDNNGFNEVTLNSAEYIKKEIILLKLNCTIFKPQNEADRKEAGRFINFVNWCEKKQEFTNPQMFKELRKNRIYKNSAYNENMIFSVLSWFGLTVKRDTNTNLIQVVNNKYEK